MKKTFLNLGRQPLANDFKLKEENEFYNLKLEYDKRTKLISINKRFNKKIMFNKSYPYRSSQSSTIKKHFNKLSKIIIKQYNPKNILEIGSNHGAFACNFLKSKITCIEPCLDVAEELRKKNFKVYAEYFDKKLVKNFIKKNMKFDLIFSANTITHIDNINNVFKNINKILTDDGVFILEEPSFLECFKKNAFDQFYNEHIYVLSTISLTNILKNLGLKIFKIENVDVHGGSIRYYIIKEKNKLFKIHKSFKTQIQNEKKFKLDKFSSCVIFKKNVNNAKKKITSNFS